jgi:hypothetical protein
MEELFFSDNAVWKWSHRFCAAVREFLNTLTDRRKCS